MSSVGCCSSRQQAAYCVCKAYSVYVGNTEWKTLSEWMRSHNVQQISLASLHGSLMLNKYFDIFIIYVDMNYQNRTSCIWPVCHCDLVCHYKYCCCCCCYLTYPHNMSACDGSDVFLSHGEVGFWRESGLLIQTDRVSESSGNFI